MIPVRLAVVCHTICLLQLLSNCMLSEFRVPVLLEIMYMATQELFWMSCLPHYWAIYHSEIYTIDLVHTWSCTRSLNWETIVT